MGRAPVAPKTPTGDWERRAAVNAAFSVIAQVSSKVVTFAWTAVAARRLSQNDFGSFNFAVALGLLLASVAEWGFDTALVQRVSRTPRDAPRLFTHAVVCEVIVAVPLFAVVGGITMGRIDGNAAKAALGVVLVATVLDTFSDTIRGVAAGLQQQRSTATALTVARVATAAIAIPVLLLGGGLVGLSIALLASYALGLVLHVYALRQLGVSLRPSTATRTGLVSFVRGTAAFGISTLVLAALARFDVVLLEAMKGSLAVANYSAAYKLFDTVLFLTFAVNGALFPVMSAQSDDHDEMRRTLRSGLVLLTAVYVAFAAVCALDGRAVLTVLFGARYGRSSSGALQWLAAAPLVFSAGFLFGSALAAMRKPRGLVVAAVTATAVNVLGDLIAIPRFAGSGAALMTTVGYGTETAILYIAYRRAGGHRLAAGRSLLPTFAALVPLVAVVSVAPGPPLARAAVGLLLYAAVWVALTRLWEPEQFGLFRRMVSRRAAGPAAPTDPAGATAAPPAS